MLKLVIVLLLAPILAIIFGFVLVMFPPKNINNYVGYRTKRSKQSVDHWLYAQKMAGGYLILIGFILLLIAVFVAFFLKAESLESLYIVLGVIGFQIITLPLVILFTEKKLKAYQVPSIKDKIKKEDIIE